MCWLMAWRQAALLSSSLKPQTEEMDGWGCWGEGGETDEQEKE